MRTSLARLLLAASTSLACATPGLAQSEPGASAPPRTSAEEPVNSSDIIVTARRVEERLQDVPISITVFNQQQLNNRNVVTGADIATYTPSLSSNGRFGAETASFSIRGFAQESFTSPSVGVYFADVIGPRVNAGTAGGNGAGVGQYFDLQNIQVLKGPQGTLFGRNTTGGAVLIVPQRPKDTFGGYIEGSYGNYDMYRIQAVLNVPLADAFKVRLGFERQKRDGYLHSRSGIGPRDYDDTDYYAGRLSILSDLTPNLENYVIARYSHSSTNGTYGKLIAANAPGCDAGVDRSRYAYPGSPDLTLPGATPASTASFLAPLACAGTLARAKANNYGFWDVESGNPHPFLRIDQWGLINTTTWRASDTVTIKNIISYQEFRQAQSLNIGNDNYAIPDSNPNPAFRGVPFTWVGIAPSQGLANAEQSTFTEEFQVQGHSEKLDYVLGGYYEHADPLSPYQGTYANITYATTLTAPNVPLPPGVGLPVLVVAACSNLQALQCRPIDSLGSGQIPALVQNSLTSYAYQNIGAFAQGTYKFSEQLSLTAGIRYTIDKTKAVGSTRELFFYAPNQYAATCADFVTPAPGYDTCRTTSRQKSKKPTWLIDLDYKPTQDVLLYAKYARGYRQGNINASNTIPQAWGPEKVDAYEIGAKTSYRRGEFNGYFNIAAFYNDFSNQQLAASLIPAPNSQASPAQAIVNAGKSRIDGIELDAVANYSIFSLAVGYAYLDTKLKTFTAPNFPGYLPVTPNSDPGGPLPFSPKHKVTLTPTVRLPIAPSVGRVSLSATYVYTSSQISTAASQSPFGTVPGYSLLNANLDWSGLGGLPIDVSGFVTNLTNTKYKVFSGGGWASTGAEYALLGLPRMYGLRVRCRFGGEAN